MCGVCGFTGPRDFKTLLKMSDSIFHRGPDEDGYFENDDISFGVRRLSIVDLKTGHQPIFNEDKSIVVIFNGEIYNYPELREELKLNGHNFRTDHSDTEVIVHLYEEYGDKFLDKLNGMFAIAIWDIPRRRLFLARDRVGIKPLYFSYLRGRLIFGSEIKSILKHPDIKLEPNFLALSHYFSLKNIPAPWSAFKDIEQIRPGEYLVYENGEMSRHTWWRPFFNENIHRNEAESAYVIRSMLEDAVRIQMRADVPFGAYLSGGIDSSSIVSLMANLSGRKIKTFSLVYSNDFINKAADRDHARLISQEFDTEHYEYFLTFPEVVESIDAIISSFDEPFSGVTSTYFLTRLISKHVKVALSGDGADEIFGSYLPHRLAQPLHAFTNLKFRMSQLTRDEKNLLAPYSEKIDYLSSIFETGNENERRMALYLWTDLEKRTLFSESMINKIGSVSTASLIAHHYEASCTADPLNRALYCDFVSLLPDQVLAFVDRLSMAHSVEVRPPFLDHRLVEYAATIPGNLKIRDGREKHIFKEAMRGIIPQVVIDRPKEGFVLPINHWLLYNLREKVEETLHPNRLALHGLLRPEKVRALLDAHYNEAIDYGSRIWNLFNFQIWWEKYFSL